MFSPVPSRESQTLLSSLGVKFCFYECRYLLRPTSLSSVSIHIKTSASLFQNHPETRLTIVNRYHQEEHLATMERKDRLSAKVIVILRGHKYTLCQP